MAIPLSEPDIEASTPLRLARRVEDSSGLASRLRSRLRERKGKDKGARKRPSERRQRVRRQLKKLRRLFDALQRRGLSDSLPPTALADVHTHLDQLDAHLHDALQRRSSKAELELLHATVKYHRKAIRDLLR